MAITSGIASAGTVITTLSLIHVPPGPCTVLLANAGTAPTVYVGSGTAVTVAGGFPVPSGLVPPVVIPVYAGCAATPMSVVCSSGSASLAWIVTSPTGGTGTGTLG
jgi:hypothetical protein